MAGAAGNAEAAAAVGALPEDVHTLRKAILLVNTLTKELDIHAAMESVRHVALELLECDRVTLFLVIESRRELRGRIGPAGDGRTITVKFGEGIAGTVAQEGVLMNIQDAYSHPLFQPEVDRMTHYTTRSILCCAIHDMSGKIVAVVQALNKHSGSFTAADEQHIQLFGVHLGNTLAKSQFFETAKREKERLTTLSNCFKRLNAVTSLNGALDAIAVAVKQLVCAEHVCVLLMDNARKVLWTSIINEHTRGRARLVRVPEGEGIIGSCAADKQQRTICFALEQGPRDPKLLQLFRVLSGTRSQLSEVLLQPVLDATSGAVMAVLAAFNKVEAGSSVSDLFYEATFTPSDSEALDVFSNEVADVLAARAVEVSFACALSIVLSSSSGSGVGGGGGGDTGDGSDADVNNSANNNVAGGGRRNGGARGGEGDGGGGADPDADADVDAGGSERSSSYGGGSSRLDQLSSMLKAQLLDYGDVGSSGLGSGTGGGSHQHHHHPLLQHSHTMGGPAGRASSGSRGGSQHALLRLSLGGGGGGLSAVGLDGVSSGRLSSSSTSGPLRRFSSISVGSRASSLYGGGLLTSQRSFHHQLPGLPGGQDADSSRQRRSELLTWELDCGCLNKEQLVRVAYDIFQLSGVLAELDIPEAELSGFLGAVAGHYHPPSEVPYHNFGHVVQVLHCVWMMLETSTARMLLSPEEVLVLLIAAICHDLDHDGLTNSFHINSQSPLAQRYNDRSVQENHHCALTFALLGQRGSNLLCRFVEQDEYFAARRLLIDAILATDMHHHFALTQELVSHGLAFSAEDDADRALLMKALLHAADIGNHIRPWPIALASAQRVHEEFRRQVVRERELGLPVAPHMDAPESAFHKMEVSFIDYIAGPLWGRLTQIFPELSPPLQHMRLNREKFAALAQSSADLVAAGGTSSSTGAGGAAEPAAALAAPADVSTRTSWKQGGGRAAATAAAPPPSQQQQQQQQEGQQQQRKGQHEEQDDFII